MLNQQDTKAQCKMRSALADPAAQQRGRIATLFKRLYSRQGTLTHKEFVWPAVYLLTLGKVIDSIAFVPMEIINFMAPVRDASLLIKSLVIIYTLFMSCIIFFYPLYNSCAKSLRNTIVYKRFYDLVLILILVFIYVHPLVFSSENLFRYMSGGLSCLLFVTIVYFVSKKLAATSESDTD